MSPLRQSAVPVLSCSQACVQWSTNSCRLFTRSFVKQLVGTRFLGQRCMTSPQCQREEELDQQATPSSSKMLAELEAIWHKRDEAAQQNEAPVAESVEGQLVPVKIETLLGKVVQLKLCNRTGSKSPGKSVC